MSVGYSFADLSRVNVDEAAAEEVWVETPRHRMSLTEKRGTLVLKRKLCFLSRQNSFSSNLADRHVLFCFFYERDSHTKKRKDEIPTPFCIEGGRARKGRSFVFRARRAFCERGLSALSLDGNLSRIETKTSFASYSAVVRTKIAAVRDS